MKRKGFTLIELLAVIVILAVIALITTTIITKVVENSRKNAAKNSALNYLDVVEKYVMYHEVNDTKYPEEIESSSIYQISNKEYTVPDGKTAVENKNLNDILGNTVKGEKPDTGIVEFDKKRKVVSASMIVNNYNVTCTSSTSCSVEGKDTDPTPILSIGSVTSDNTSITIPYTVEIEKGSATVECVYGTDTKYGQVGTINEENNACTLSNLTAGTTYYFKLTPKSDKNKKGQSQKSSKTTANYIPATEFKVGDYVYMVPEYVGSYTPSTNSNDASYTGCANTSTDVSGVCVDGGTIIPSELDTWIVIKNDSENIEMVSFHISSSDINFASAIGYKNFVGVLNEITKQYENSLYTIGSRSMGYLDGYSIERCTDLCWTDDYYTTDINLVKEAFGIRGIETLVASTPDEIDKSYWLASRWAHSYGHGQDYYGRFVNSDGTISYKQITDNRYPNYVIGSASIRPILTLKPSAVAQASGDGSKEKPWVLVEP